MNEITPFEAAALAPRGRTASQATMVEQSRAVAEVQAAVVVAQNRPRVVAEAMREMREVCAIDRLAEKAFFRFSRGDGNVSGESVHLARELARCWGNVVYGLVELSRSESAGQSEMMAFAWDMQTNARAQTSFIVPHIRDTKKGPKPLTDTRDVYENNANMGARRLREMIFAVLPVWYREEAADICRKTLENGGGKPLVQRIADCAQAFATIGVTRAQLEAKQGRKMDDFTAEDVAALGVVFRSIKANETTKDDEFPREMAPELPANADGFEAASAGKAAAAPPVAPPATETKPDPMPKGGNEAQRRQLQKFVDDLAAATTSDAYEAVANHDDFKQAMNWAMEHATNLHAWLTARQSAAFSRCMRPE